MQAREATLGARYNLLTQKLASVQSENDELRSAKHDAEALGRNLMQQVTTSHMHESTSVQVLISGDAL